MGSNVSQFVTVHLESQSALVVTTPQQLQQLSCEYPWHSGDMLIKPLCQWPKEYECRLRASLAALILVVTREPGCCALQHTFECGGVCMGNSPGKFGEPGFLHSVWAAALPLVY